MGYWRYNWGNRDDRYYPRHTNLTLDAAKQKAEALRSQGNAFVIWTAPLLVVEYGKAKGKADKLFGILPTGWAIPSLYDDLVKDIERRGGWNFWRSFPRHAGEALKIYAMSVYLMPMDRMIRVGVLTLTEQDSHCFGSRFLIPI